MNAYAGYAGSVITGLAIWFAASHSYRDVVWIKLTGGAPGCSWLRLAQIGPESAGLAGAIERNIRETRVAGSDDRFGLVQVEGGGRRFWLKRTGTEMSPRQLLGYLLADHGFLPERYPQHHVRQGDIVLDIGGHAGVFTYTALRRGASKVIAVEPDPGNAECLRRNFEAEIAAGRVVLVQAGAWNQPGELELNLIDSNSGTASLVDQRGGFKKVKVPVRRIDDIVSDLHLPRVDFIKMDIEGAEPEALEGAARVLATHRPRMMLDMYHRPEHPVEIPRLIHRLNPAYEMDCGPCEYHETERTIVPHVTFYF